MQLIRNMHRPNSIRAISIFELEISLFRLEVSRIELKLSLAL